MQFNYNYIKNSRNLDVHQKWNGQKKFPGEGRAWLAPKCQVRAALGKESTFSGAAVQRNSRGTGKNVDGQQ